MILRNGKKQPISNCSAPEFEYLKEDLEDIQFYLEEFSAFLPLPVISVNPLGFILDINSAFERLVRLPGVEVLGQHINSFFVEKNLFSQLTQKVTKEGFQGSEEMTLIVAETKKVPVKAHIAPRKDREGIIIGYFVGLYDITEFKRLQETLEEKVKERTSELEARTSELMDSRKALMNILEDVEAEQRKVEQERDKTVAIIKNMTDGLLIFDKENILILMNPQAKELLKIEDEEQIVNRSLKELSRKPQFVSLTQVLGRGIKDVYRERVELPSRLTLEISSLSFFSAQQKLGKMVILHDITRERLIDEMKTEFIALAAHQLRTPLAAIRWSLNLLRQREVMIDKEEKKYLLEHASEGNERMIALVNDLLNVSRIEEGRYVCRSKKLDFISLAKKVLDSYKDLIVEKRLHLKVELPKVKSLKLFLDEEKIGLAIQNLIENAIHYTPFKGEIEVIVEYQGAKNQVIFSVKDTGIGIPKESHDRIFTKFFRTAIAMKTKTKGTGLGLFITKNVIEAHGGRVWFKSQEGKGSTFYFSLPTVLPAKT